jgi:UDP-2-acetamido-2,6-beta-L-arabino-hexul-4-ose reductase
VRVLLTGSAGFLGWHTRVRLRALTEHDVVAVSRASWADLREHARGADAILHLAGVNRAADAEVEEGNVALARDVADAARRAGTATRVVFANSIQSGNGTPYGRGKEAASEILARAAADLGAAYVDVRLPNLFGEHGRPRYNSFVATFARAVIDGAIPEIVDRPVDLMHAQTAAGVLAEALGGGEGRVTPSGSPTTVQRVFDTLAAFHALYARGDIPALTSDLDLDLFNTLRAARFPDGSPIPLVPRSDDRGRLVETVRSHGGQGQTFVSTTNPGVVRGEHFHLRKVERFVVLDGEARIALRKVFSDEVVSLDVTGEAPVAVDMPTMWAHNITNVGSRPLTTLFWTNELFDPAAPDTHPEQVEPSPAAKTALLVSAP